MEKMEVSHGRFAFGVPLLEGRKACKFHLVCVNCIEMDLKSSCPQPVSMVLV
jgi:hypothetical protein